MKTEDAWVDDPVVRGELKIPRLCVQVDEPPGVTIPPEHFSGGWTVGKYGPFVKYSQQDSPDVPPSPVDAGDFNVRFRGKFPSIVDVSLFLTRGQKHWDDYALNLTRGRQLLRKWDNRWRLLIGDKDAQSGRIVWHPVDSRPVCKFIEPGASVVCGLQPVNNVRMGAVDVPVCRDHLKEYNIRHAAKRASTSR